MLSVDEAARSRSIKHIIARHEAIYIVSNESTLLHINKNPTQKIVSCLATTIKKQTAPVNPLFNYEL